VNNLRRKNPEESNLDKGTAPSSFIMKAEFVEVGLILCNAGKHF
jgi:hypothetical protein